MNHSEVNFEDRLQLKQGLARAIKPGQLDSGNLGKGKLISRFDALVLMRLLHSKVGSYTLADQRKVYMVNILIWAGGFPVLASNLFFRFTHLK